MGDMFEISTIRREDYAFHKGKSEYEDVLQCNNLPSSRTPRGHQAPAAFIILASGLSKVITPYQSFYYAICYRCFVSLLIYSTELMQVFNCPILIWILLLRRDHFRDCRLLLQCSPCRATFCRSSLNNNSKR